MTTLTPPAIPDGSWTLNCQGPTVNPWHAHRLTYWYDVAGVYGLAILHVNGREIITTAEDQAELFHLMETIRDDQRQEWN